MKSTKAQKRSLSNKEGLYAFKFGAGAMIGLAMTMTVTERKTLRKLNGIQALTHFVRTADGLLDLMMAESKKKLRKKAV